MVRQAGAHLPAQAGDADHEELVEIVGGDRQEPQLLQQRMAPVRASSSTRRLNCSQDSSRLTNRSGDVRNAGASVTAAEALTAAIAATGSIFFSAVSSLSAMPLRCPHS